MSTHDWVGTKKTKEQIWVEGNFIWDIYTMSYLERM